MPETRSVRDRLVAAVVSGRPLDLLDRSSPGPDGGEVLSEQVMRSWGPEHELAADDVTAVVRGQGLPAGATPHPRGLTVYGARILGRIDLAFVTDAAPLALVDCLLDHGISAYAAHLPDLRLRGCRITHPTVIPVDAGRARVVVDLRITDSVVTTPPHAEIGVRLSQARVDGDVSLTGSDLTSGSGRAVDADGCEIGGSLFLYQGFRARGAGARGAVRLVGARISGQVTASGAELTNDSGPALLAASCQADGGMFLAGLRARGAGEPGAVRLFGARIAGQFSAPGAELINDSGPALSADGVQVGDAMMLVGGFQARGSGERGAVRLLGARIGGQLNVSGAELTNDTGIALNADNCHVDGPVILNDGFRARGAGAHGAVRLNGARIGGQLTASGADLSSSSGPALNAARCRVDGAAFFDRGFRAHGAGPGAVIDLSDAQLGSLQINDQVTHDDDPYRCWWLDGCTYTGLPSPEDPLRWLALLRGRTPRYAAQPYQQLAAVYRAAGHDRDVRQILIAQRRDQIHRGQLGRRERAWARFTGVTLGFGWKPWLALCWLAAVVTVSVTLALILGQFGALAHPPAAPVPGTAGTVGAAAGAGTPCGIVERIGVGLDLGTPLLATATRSRDRCPINPAPATPSEHAAVTTLTIATWILQAGAWGFAALFVAGFTGAVRKT